MTNSPKIFLPGGFKQFRILKTKYHFADKNVLIIGAQSESIAEKMIDAGADSVTIIVSDYDSLMNSRLNLRKENNISVRMMDFERTDFADNVFDLVYSQAAISLTNRNKIIKEIKRILKQEGILCVGELTSLTKNYPAFVKNIFDSSDIKPLFHEEIVNYYEEKGFVKLYEEDLTSSLKSFYETAQTELKDVIRKLSEEEKSYYKKLLNKISHESNAYLKLGADKYIGFKMLILKKN